MTKTSKILGATLVIAILALASFGGVVSAQTASPRVQIQLATNGLTNPLVANSDQATVARLSLNTTGSSEPVRISSLPFILNVGNGADAGSLFNCQVYNEASPTVALNTSDSDQDDSDLSTGLNRITLNSPIVLAANTVTTLALRCDVGDDLEAGGTYTFSMNAADVTATGAVSGLAAIVTVPGGQVVIPPVVVPPVVIPGLPTTGGDGDTARNLITLTATAIALSALGVSYLDRRAKRS